MTILSTYVSGYTLTAGGYLTITATGAIGGAGLSILAGGTVVSNGTIAGGNGATGQGKRYFMQGNIGYAGNASVTLALGSLTNGATIGGGEGGTGGLAYTFAGDGGAGGAGVVLSGGVASNSGIIGGGVGGTGGYAYLYGGAGGVGGAGEMLSGGVASNGGILYGGTGGTGGISGYYVGGNGGVGGAGAALSGGTLTNTGFILAGSGGAGAAGGQGYGSGGQAGDGVDLSGGTLLNAASSAVILGDNGVRVVDGAGATVTNAGTIAGRIVAVLLANAGDRLIIDAGAVFDGAVVGGGGTLELAADTGAGTISGLGSTFAGFASVTIDAGASWTLTGTNTLAAGALGVAGGATLTVSGDSLTLGGGGLAITNAGTIGVDGAAFTGLVFAGNETLTGAGAVSLGAKGLIAGSAAGDALTNMDNTISGGGFIEGPLAFTNGAGGVIDADNDRMLINMGGTSLVNAGLIEAKGKGLLLVRNTTIANSGTIRDQSQIQLDVATIDGGTVSVAAGARLSVLSASTISDADIANSGLANISSGVLTLRDTILVDTAGGIVRGGAATGLSLVQSTISGGGSIQGPVSLDIAADGAVDADDGRLLIATSGVSVVNAGLIEAEGTGLLLIRATTVANSGTISAGYTIQLDGSVIDGGVVGVAAGARLLSTLHASTITGAGIVNAGTITGAGGGLTLDGGVTNTGLLQALNGDLTITGAVSGSGKAQVFGTGVLEVDGPMGETVAFSAGSTGQLVLEDTAAFTGAISGLSKTGASSIDLRDIAFAAGDTATWAAGKVSIEDANGDVLASLKLAGNYSGSTFDLATDGHGGTTLKDPIPAAFASAMASFGAPAAGAPAHAATMLTTPPRLAVIH